ncbi:phosphopantetheine-binding protein [Mobilibacterium timonense]|uniref:phosphopantetheine-binding protein n=1 Tax=Mobilibacterium timonense TaxID=1871012 RepID=UPI00098650F5|nr:phosphopantetheine-binding protein [Mobilibacterium timonense]MBM6990336.1 acyl carrier protein [Mobilibacterium timonense]
MDTSRIIEILESVKDDLDYTKETALIDDELLDSFDVVAIIGSLSDEYDVTISVDDMTPENFNSAEAIAQMVDRLIEEQN